MTTESMTGVRGSRLRIARTRGAVSGVLLLILGAWAAIVPFIGPYLDLGFTPRPDDAWYWTGARGYLEVAPGAAAFLGGLLLLISASRLLAGLGAWLGIAGGAWLIVGPPLADYLDIGIGTPDPAAASNVQAMAQLFYFFAVGAAILLVAAFALGRLSVHGIRDVRAAERRAEADAAREAAARDAAAREAADREAEQREQTFDANGELVTPQHERGTAPGPAGEADGNYGPLPRYTEAPSDPYAQPAPAPEPSRSPEAAAGRYPPPEQR